MSCSSNEPLAYLNGREVPAEQMCVAATDSGFMLGIAVAEQLRTMAGELFHAADHLARLFRGLEVVGWAERVNRDELLEQMERVAIRHCRLLESANDVGVTVFVTPGTYGIYREADHVHDDEVTVGVHSYPLPFWLWNDLYRAGQKLVVTEYRQVQNWNWPPYLKCRSRMHYYLADQAARRRDPAARALLLDATDAVAETATANVLGVTHEGDIVAPTDDVALPGISLATTFQLARQIGLRCTQRRIELDELLELPEVLLASTPYCLVPVTQINDSSVGSGTPGPLFEQLIGAWDDLVGLDLRQQARQLARSS